LNERDVLATEPCTDAYPVELVERSRVVEYDGRNMFGAW
jgi:hypothetical protein